MRQQLSQLFKPLFFLNKLYLTEHIRFTEKFELRRYRDFSYTRCPHTCTTSLLINISHQSGKFVTTNLHRALIITPNPIVYITNCSWCHIFTGFGHACNDLCPQLQWLFSPTELFCILICFSLNMLVETGIVSTVGLLKIKPL